MIETELKIKYNLLEEKSVIDFCKGKGLVYSGTVREVDTYYNAPHKDLLLSDQAFRLRQVYNGEGESIHNTLTYKGPTKSKGCQKREEIESSLADGRALMRILSEMDFRIIMAVDKTRKQYNAKSLSICIDKVIGLGDFIEIEMLAETDNDKIATDIHKLYDELPVDYKEIEPKTYLELQYNAKNKSESLEQYG